MHIAARHVQDVYEVAWKCVRGSEDVGWGREDACMTQWGCERERSLIDLIVGGVISSELYRSTQST